MMQDKLNTMLLLEQRIIAIYESYPRGRMTDRYEHFDDFIKKQVEHESEKFFENSKKLVLYFLNNNEWTVLSNKNLRWRFQGDDHSVRIADILGVSINPADRIRQGMRAAIFLIDTFNNCYRVPMESGNSLESMYNILLKFPRFFSHDIQKINAYTERLKSRYPCLKVYFSSGCPFPSSVHDCPCPLAPRKSVEKEENDVKSNH